MGHQAAISAQPRERELDHPSPADNFETAVLIGALDDFDRDPLACEIGVELAARISAVGKDMGDERERSPGCADEVVGAIAILHACRNDLDAEQQPYRVDEDIALDAFRLFPSVITDRIRITPPFSVAFTA